jgi:hypothetical protein
MRRFTVVTLLGALALSAGCASVSGTATGKPDVSGELSIQGPTFGDTRMTLDRCASGEHQVFLGADFAGPGTLVARLAVDPLSGPGLRVFDSTAPFGKSLVVRQSECDHFHFSLERSGWRINDVWVLHLTLDIDCSTPSGDAIRGLVSSASCW